MLVLSRRIGEGITIGTDIRVQVIEIKGGQVRLGIEAPPAIQVHRDEVYLKIRNENQQAASSGALPLDALKQLRKPKA
jgi:carbon storage regulator